MVAWNLLRARARRSASPSASTCGGPVDLDHDALQRARPRERSGVVVADREVAAPAAPQAGARQREADRRDALELAQSRRRRRRRAARRRRRCAVVFANRNVERVRSRRRASTSASTRYSRQRAKLWTYVSVRPLLKNVHPPSSEPCEIRTPSPSPSTCAVITWSRLRMFTAASSDTMPVPGQYTYVDALGHRRSGRSNTKSAKGRLSSGNTWLRSASCHHRSTIALQAFGFGGGEVARLRRIDAHVVQLPRRDVEAGLVDLDGVEHDGLPAVLVQRAAAEHLVVLHGVRDRARRRRRTSGRS